LALLVGRYRHLLAFSDSAGFEDEAHWLRQRIAALGG
jgi:hypothetical protein